MASQSELFYEMRLYVFGKTGKSEAAVRTVEKICTSYLKGNCSLEVVDLSENPERAKEDCILATPLLLRLKPTPECRIIGDLSKVAEVLSSLGIELG